MDDNDERTCGKGLAAYATLPDKLADVVDALAATLESHTRSLGDDVAAREEHEVYGALAKEHRAIAARLRAAAEHMAGSRDLPMGTHDEKVLGDTTSVAAFTAFVDAEVALASHLERALERDRAMLEGLRGGGEFESKDRSVASDVAR